MPERQDKTFNDWSRNVLEQIVALNAQVEGLGKELDAKATDLAKDIQDKYTLVQEGVDERYKHLERKVDKVNILLTGNRL